MCQISLACFLPVYFEQNDTADVESNNGTEVSEILEDDTLLDNDNDEQEQRKPPLRCVHITFNLLLFPSCLL